MFYSQFILAKKGPLGTIWIAAHLERKLRKNQVTETNISVSVDSILFPEVPIALRLSGHLLLGVVRIYSRKVNYLFHDCSEALVKIKQAFHAGAVDLPPEAATAPFHSITLPETFDLDEFEPLPDREMHLLHSNGAADHHVTTREQITLQDPLEDSSYLESQFGLDERFPEGDAPRLGIDFDEDLLDKPSREGSPDAVTLQEDEVLPSNMDEGMDYDQMDRMETMDMDDHHEPGTPALGMDHMDLDYQPEVEVEEMDDGDLNRGPEVIQDLEPDHQSQQIELDNLEPDLNKPDQLEPATPGTLEPEQEEGKGKEILVEEPEKEEVQDEEGSAQKEGLDETENVQKLDEETLPAEKGEVEEEEVEERAGREGEEEVIGEKQEEDRHEIDNGPEKMLLEDESKADDESKQDVPEYETVMSAVEVPNQEPDVFDLEQDMEREMPSMVFKDQDEYMEDKEPLLAEDREVGMELENQFVPAEDPASPLNSSPHLQAFNPDVLPGDDDVLASLLGGGTLALKVVPTPAEMAVAVKPRRKQAKRKRKIVMDMNTILPADVMREQLMNTDDIRRVRRKAPCTRQELWSVQKDALGQQIFSVHSVPGLGPELRVLFQRVYVAGGANLPLADDVQAEPELEREPEPEPEPGSFGNEVVPEQQEVFPVHEVAGEVHEEPQGVEPHVEPVMEDQEVQEPPHEGFQVQGPSHEVFPNEPEMEPEPLDIPMHESPRHENEARSVDDVREAGNALHMEQTEAYAVEGDQTVGMKENTTSDADHAPAEISKEDEMHLSPTRMMAAAKSPNIPSEDLSLTDGHETVEEKEEAAEKVDAEIGTAPVPIQVPGPELERQSEPELELAPEPEPEPGVAEAVEAVHVVENVSEEMAEAMTDAMPEAIPEVVPSNFAEDRNVEEHNDFQEELAAPHTDDARVSSPAVQVEEAQPIEEPVVEELGFLADAGDTVFLAADDDDLCEEAEDFQDGSDYGQKETLVQDNSGWSARTRAVGQYLRSTLESKYAHMRKREEEGIPKLGLEQILVGKSRKEAARMFFETLVLKTKDYIHVEQDSPYGNIHISARPKLLKANF